MLNFRRNLCSLIKNKVKEELSTKSKHKFISHIPLYEFESAKFQSKLRHSLKHRCSKLNYDQIKMQYDLLQDIERIMMNLEAAKKEMNRKFNSAETKEMLEKYQYEGKLIREDIRSMKEVLVSLREDVNLASQKFPNLIHDRTPLGNDKDIIYEQGGKFLSDIGNVKESEVNSMFSTGKDAWLDLILPVKAMEYLTQTQGYVQTSNPDFLRTFVTRAGGIADSEHAEIYEEDVTSKDQVMKLVGGGSFASFLPYITKLSLFPSSFPLKLVSMGRQYEAKDEGTASQAQTVQILDASRDENEAIDRLDLLIDAYKNYYATYGQSFRMSYAPAKFLSRAEALRVDIEIESAFTNEFITVANIRYFSDYISKRLLFNYRIDNKKYAFPHVIGGTFLHMPYLLSAINSDKIEIDSYFMQ